MLRAEGQRDGGVSPGGQEAAGIVPPGIAGGNAPARRSSDAKLMRKASASQVRAAGRATST
jgi:hypothetical protein